MKRPGTEKEKKMDAYPFAIQIKQKGKWCQSEVKNLNYFFIITVYNVNINVNLQIPGKSRSQTLIQNLNVSC